MADKVGTPFFCYSTATLERHYKVYADAFDGLDATVCFAVKANSNQAVLKTLANLGAGADVVSVGEMRRALRAGMKPAKIIFSGVGKADAEMREALEADIAQINVESIPELNELNRVAIDMGKKARIALRVNPHVDAKTHEKIATGKAENKFGIDWTRAIEVYRDAAAMDGIEVTGIAMHIGSQLTDLARSVRRLHAWPGWLNSSVPKALIFATLISVAGLALPIRVKHPRFPMPMVRWCVKPSAILAAISPLNRVA